MADFKQWFEGQHGVWPWHPSDSPSLAFNRLADGLAEFANETLSVKSSGRDIVTPWGVRVQI